MPDEQHDTPVTFSRDEIRRIRQLITELDQPLLCPRCGSALTVGKPVGDGAVHTIWAVRCNACRRTVHVADLPRDRWPPAV